MGVPKKLVLKCGRVFESMSDFATYVGKTIAAVSKDISRGKTPDDIVEYLEKRLHKVAVIETAKDKLATKTASVVARGAKYAEGYSRDYLILEDGTIYNQKTGRYLKPVYCNVHSNGYDAGYYYVNVKKADGTRVRHAQHTLVCTAFHGVKPDGVRMTVDHIDRDVSNNSAGNLRWCEQKENNRNRGNHKYLEWNGEVYIAPEILEILGIEYESDEWRYMLQRLDAGDTVEEAQSKLESRRYYNPGKGTAKPVEIPSSIVTGVWFKSMKAFGELISRDASSIRYRLEKGDTYEQIIERFCK